MDLQSKINRLNRDACPSIRLRLMRELHASAQQDEGELQAQICRDARVQQVLAAQRDGWFYEQFHGFNSMESSIRFLIEMGLPPQFPALSLAAAALKQATQERLLAGIGKPGIYLGEYGGSGSRMIQAWLLAELGHETDVLVQDALARTLQVMDFTRKVPDMDAVSRIKAKQRVLLPHCMWPDLYHFRLLAASQCWRTPLNLDIVDAAVENMLRLQPIPYLHILHNGQVMAPASFGLQSLLPSFESMSDSEWMPWFQRMILFARLGLLRSNATLKHYAQSFLAWVEDINDWATKPLSHTYFSKWGAYTGLMLEKDWRAGKRRMNDLLFRTVLIGAGITGDNDRL